MRCKQCDATLSGSQKIYCSNKCQSEYKFELYIERWLAGQETGEKFEGEVSGYIRRYLHEQIRSRCVKCGWSQIHPITGKVPLTVNHIDENWNNNELKNLELICPNCHSLTPNYGSLNRGNGRQKR